MPNNASAFPTNVARLFAASLLLLAASPSAGQALDDLKLGYLATFANGSLEPSVDRRGIGPLEKGDSQQPGIIADWKPSGGALILEVTRPDAPVIGPVATGVFATEVDFGPGTAFKASATFINPDGPDALGDIWAIGLGARTGGNNDLAGETRVSVTLQVRGTSLRFNSPGGGPGEDLPPEIYNEIFSPTDPQPFTLVLLVDRINGAGEVSIKVGDRLFSRSVNFPAFPASSGPPITAVGPSVVIASAPGKTATVNLREFRIWLPSNSMTNSTNTCSDELAEFHCREAPDNR